MNQNSPDHLQLPSSSSQSDKTHYWDACQNGKFNHSSQISLKFLFFLLSGLYIPVILLWFGIIPLEYRFHVSFIVIMSFLLFAIQRRYRFRELGYRIDNFSSSLCWNLIFCVLGSFCLYCAYKFGILNPIKIYTVPYIYVFYIVFLAPVQELLFRGILFAEMRRMGNIDCRIILLVSTFSFCFLHIIYNRFSILIVSFVSGLIWSVIYIKWPNIWGISLSHALLGSLAIFLGVI